MVKENILRVYDKGHPSYANIGLENNAYVINKTRKTFVRLRESVLNESLQHYMFLMQLYFTMFRCIGFLDKLV